MHIYGMLKGLTHQHEKPIQYFIHIGDEEHSLNPFLGGEVELQFEGEIECVYCSRKIKKTYNSGSCFPCFRDRAENDLCIVKPELCHFEHGTCRDEQFGERHCMVPHYVYLALSSDVKVGLTRKHNQMKRWGDQGAVQAVPLAELPTRKMAGELEVALSKHLPDKTNWRKMLKGEVADKDVCQVREEVLALIPDVFKPFILTEEEMVEFTYPILEEIDKIKSYSLDKQPLLQDRLIGIKGQYLIFEKGVINMRKYAGYHISMKNK